MDLSISKFTFRTMPILRQLKGIQEGMRQARIDVRRKAIEQGILDMAYKEGKDFVYNWARSIANKGMEISFVESKN